MGHAVFARHPSTFADIKGMPLGACQTRRGKNRDIFSDKISNEAVQLVTFGKLSIKIEF
ncbi:hypothetical protein [Magnetospirillum sulfuroxidans]|uniref:Transposase n=1 Tax=Magnetospirillum sulfuroxidans TaxID=611300 RepID=A0ABS5IB25_9PROT|nr:hypothetical protein [Magnetospirillum sulfuroxidans]MBR9971631.1 hypothetical protein [Magnetospirillum sulfuroxidans]